MDGCIFMKGFYEDPSSENCIYCVYPCLYCNDTMIVFHSLGIWLVEFWLMIVYLNKDIMINITMI